MNIEKTISEHAVSDILTPMLECQDRIVTEDVAPLFDQATGLDTPPASGSVTTTIEESRSVITAIIRKAWTATLTMLCGASVIGYITAAYTYLRNRLQGNETYGIPDRRSEISASSPLAANLALLNDRKISGVPEAEDGMSLVRILCDSAVGGEITQLLDETKGWTMNRTFNNLFPNAKTVTLGCRFMQADRANYFNNLSHLEELELTDCEMISGDWSYGSGSNHKIIGNNDALRKFKTPRLKELRSTTSWSQCPLLVSNPVLEEWYSPKFEKTNCSYMVHNCPNLQRVVFGKLIADFVSAYGSYGENFTGSNSKMVHFEIGAGTAVSLHLNWWNPSYILSDNPTGTDLIEEGSTAQNNLQQFLENFRDYIADKLQGGYPIGQGPILTLSQAVRNAIHAAESTYGIENIIITQKGWTISPAPN